MLMYPAHWRGVLISEPVGYLHVYNIIYIWEFMGNMDKCPDYSGVHISTVTLNA